MNLVMRCCALVSILSLGLWLGGCGQEGPTTPPGAEVARLDEHRSLGEPVVAGNLTVWPIYTDAPLDIGEFLTLQEAQEQKVAVVRELGSAGQQNDAPGEAATQAASETEPVQRHTAANDAQSNEPTTNEQISEGSITIGGGDQAEVNRVTIENTGELPILVVAGTIIDGGKQDRQIGQDFVIAAGATVDVDAFCVEQGRWSSHSVQELRAGDTVTHLSAGREDVVLRFAASRSAGIAVKGVRAAGQYEKNQQMVWDNVAGALKDVEGAENATQTLMATVEKADKKVLARRNKLESAVLDAFAELARSGSGPVGFAYAINGKPVTVRAFAHERILQSQLPLFVKAMALEAEMASDKAGANVKASAADVIALVKNIEAAEEEMFETRASNTNAYGGNDFGFKARCVLKNGALGLGKVVVTEDWTAR